MSSPAEKPVKFIPNLANKKRFGLWFHWLNYTALLGLFVWINFVAEGGSWKLWLVQTVPVLLPLVGMITMSHRAFSWFCFILLFYFSVSVVNVGMPSDMVKAYDYVELYLSIVLFFSSMLCSRWIQYWNYWSQTDTPASVPQ